ncbi:hypothetical protein GPA10_28145 [Streptomyces sp. p1417]|uniref:HTH luxR-type domain-containing protein n=1 Tax=Streptomyces typhae TaxID=2681492 RepID=A0A6L6X4N2_9ACTN|nr:hypothetical protein [Streptomyces typhae]
MFSTGLTVPGKTAVPGRHAEAAHVCRLLEQLRDGTGGCLMTEGPEGIGKSHLLAFARSEAARLGLRTAPGEALVAADNARARIHELNSRVRPVLIPVDTAERLSATTARLLLELIRDTAHLPVLWLVARRTGREVSAASAALEEIASRHATRLRLRPVDAAAVEGMGAGAFGAAMEPRLLQLLNRCGGAPGLVWLLLDALADEDLVRVRAGRAGLRSDELPRRVRDAVALRIDDLSGEARWLVPALAVFDRPCSLHEAKALLGWRTMQVAAAVDEALAKGVLVERKQGIDFCYPLIRDAVYENLPEATRTALHREAAALLQCDEGPADEIARHITLGSRPGEDTAGRLFAFIERTSHSTKAVTGSVRLLATVGHHEEARALVASVLHGRDHATTDRPAQVRTLLAVASAWLYTGRNDGLTGQAIGFLDEETLTPLHRARLLTARSVAHLCDHEPEAALRTARTALHTGEQSGDLLTRLLADMILSRCALDAGDLDEAVSRACQAMQLAHLGGRDTAHHYPHLMMAPALVAQDELTEAEIMLRLGEQQADRQGDTWLRPMWHHQRALLQLAAARLEEAAQSAETAAACAEPHSPVGSAALALLGHLALLRGDVTTARYHLRCAALGPFDTLDCGLEDLLWRRGVLQDAEGDPEGAFRTLRPLYGSLPTRPKLLVREPGAAALLVRLARCSGSRAQAATVVAVMQDLAARHPAVRSLHGAALHAEAVLHDDVRVAELAHREQRLAARPLALAAALESAGVLLRADHQEERATNRLHQARSLYEKAGAELHARRVRRLEKEQLPRPASTKDQTPVPGWGSLTESERRVGMLVAQGLTNREVAKRLFLSPHTVDSHLRQCFAKFSVNNRVELTRAVLEHHTPADPENT